MRVLIIEDNEDVAICLNSLGKEYAEFGGDYDVIHHSQLLGELLAAGRIPVIAGTGSNNTREALSLTKHAQDVGADAALVITPYYNKPSQRGLIANHKAIAEAVYIPQILYNVPFRTAAWRSACVAAMTRAFICCVVVAPSGE